MPHVKDLPESARRNVPPDHVIPRPPAEQRDRAICRQRIEVKLIADATPFDEATLHQALAAADRADGKHAKSGDQDAADALIAILAALGLDADEDEFWTHDDSASAFVTARREAVKTIGHARVAALVEGVTDDPADQFEARLRLRSAIRRKLAEDVQRLRALNAANAGNSEPLKVLRRRAELEKSGAAFDEMFSVDTALRREGLK